MEVSQAYIMSPAEVFEELSVACLIYPCIGTASSLFQSLTLGIEKHCQRLRKPTHSWCHLPAKGVSDYLTRQTYSWTWV